MSWQEEYRKMPHGEYEEKAKAKLRRLGYKILNYEEWPRWIKDLGGPDIVAVKDGEYVVAEVKPSDQLRRYSKAKARLIFVTNVEEGERVEVWGDKELAE